MHACIQHVRVLWHISFALDCIKKSINPARQTARTVAIRRNAGRTRLKPLDKYELTEGVLHFSLLKTDKS